MVRCDYCQVATQYCLCAHQPNIETDVAVMLIVSENEVLKPSNTGHLILDVVKEGYVYQWNRTEPNEEMLALLANDDYQPFVVFPDEYVDQPARLMDQSTDVFAQGKKPLMILLDGSWREARRMFRKSPYLDALSVVSIQPQVLSQYMMRKSENEQHLSTAEVAVAVLEQLGQHNASKTLDDWFRAFRETYLLTKTRLKPDLTRPELNRYLAANAELAD